MVHGTAMSWRPPAKRRARFVLMSALGLDERSRERVPYYAAKWEMERTVKKRVSRT